LLGSNWEKNVNLSLTLKEFTPTCKVCIPYPPSVTRSIHAHLRKFKDGDYSDNCGDDEYVDDDKNKNREATHYLEIFNPSTSFHL
jgi:hypothetical protein